MTSLILSFVFFNSLSIAGFSPSSPLSESELLSITESTGLSLAASYSEGLYPLGGYSGARIGFGYRMISNSQLRQSQPGISGAHDLSLFELSLSKGLYSNLDFSFAFTPIREGSSFTSFSGGLRWSFFEFSDKPIHFSLGLSGRTSNWNNKVTFLNQTFDLVGQYNLDPYFAYFGIGSALVRSQFVGGASGVTLSGRNEIFEASRGRPIIGSGWQGRHWGFGIELSHFVETTIAIKLSITDFYDFFTSEF